MQDKSNTPIAERWHDVAMRHADAEAAAHMLEESKSAVLSQKKLALIRAEVKLSDARAETMVKASDEWQEFIEALVRARRAANRLKVEKEYLRMRFSEWISEDANQRVGARIP